MVACTPWSQAPVLGSRSDRWFLPIFLFLCLLGEHRRLTGAWQGYCVGILFWETDLTTVFGRVRILNAEFGHFSPSLSFHGPCPRGALHSQTTPLFQGGLGAAQGQQC